MGAVFTPSRTVVSVKRFQDMIAAGVWRDDERIELIEGEIVDMAPIGGPHAWAVTRAAELLRARIAERAHVWIQLPIVISDHSQPQPDLALIRRKPGGYVQALPTGGDVLLVVEVSDTTLAYDRSVKMRLYAAGGIAQYWIVDVEHKRLEVYSEPAATGYLCKAELDGGHEVAVQAFPDVKFRVEELFDAG
jgi:Uma2 family endonuclease